jgi:glycosyltransferase involved in cell wall biosynthesis
LDVSVVIPTYNRYELLTRAVASVITQSYPPKEIIVVDEGSNDTTANIQQDYPDIIYIYQSNQGVSAARNKGIETAKSEWIAFLDSDDTWHKEKLQKQMQFHQNNPEILMSYTDEVWIRDARVVKIPKKYRKIGKDVFIENLSYCNIAPSSVVMHEKIIKKVGLFDEKIPVCEDYDLWLRIALEHTIGYIDEALIYKYAGHQGQLSFAYWGMDRFRVQTLERLLRESCGAKREILLQELIKKYTLLQKGAIKYAKMAENQIYEQRLKQLKAQTSVKDSLKRY